MSFTEKIYKKVSGVVMDDSQREANKTNFMELSISDNLRVLVDNDTRNTKDYYVVNDRQSFVNKVNASKNHNGRNDLEIKLHAKPLT